MSFNKDKYKSLVHYICHRAEESKLGSTKLNKILWYSEAINYLDTGKAITGEVFRKGQFGPIPFHILPIINELKNSGILSCDDMEYYNYLKKTYHCLTEPEEVMLDEGEKAIVDKVTDTICEKHTAASISQLSHDSIWEMAEDGEELPLFSVLVSNIEQPSEEAINWARSVPINDE